jgi:ribosomal protein S12 methylthiotransferase accessory factor
MMADSDRGLASALNSAADSLLADPTLSIASAGDARLLRFLEYNDRDETAARVRMLRAGARLERLFLLPVPDAPGLVFFGGEANPAVLGRAYAGVAKAGLAGSGLTPRRAFEACVGEGAEYLSQIGPRGGEPEPMVAPPEPASDRLAHAFISGVLAAARAADRRPIAWITARNLITDGTMRFPADLCQRRPSTERDFDPPLKLSTGCSAGSTLETATARAILELIERDAVALWWRGGQRGRAIPTGSEASTAAVALLDQLRQGKRDRLTHLLDITTDVGVPVVIASSTRPNGFGFAFGFGCRPNRADAARSAIFELCQVELSQHVIAAKQKESGDAALNDSDRKQLRRAAQFNALSCALLAPEGEITSDPAWLPDEPAAALPGLLERLDAMGIAAYAIDLTRADLAIPVVRVLAPGLQLEPCEIAGERLMRMIAATGGGAQYTHGIGLL